MLSTALPSDVSGILGVGEVGLIPIELIVPNPRNFRTHFDPEKIKELAASLQAGGQIQIVTVRLLTTEEKEGYAGKHYMLVGGERRLKAAQLIGMTALHSHVVAYNEYGR